METDGMAPYNTRLSKRKRISEPADEEIITDESHSDKKPAGFETWETSTHVIGGGEMMQMSKYKDDVALFSKTVDVQHDDAFTLQAVTLTEGPFSGCHALVLRPITSHFRLLDLPPELRVLVYGELLDEDHEIAMDDHKPRYDIRRPVRNFFRDPRPHAGYQWDATCGKWIGQPPSPHALLRVCRQIHQEAAAIAYGYNKFAFASVRTMRLFLDQIGSMRTYLKAARLHDARCVRNAIAPVFRNLQSAKFLTSLSLDHKVLCETYYANRLTPDISEPDGVVPEYMRAIVRLMKSIHKAQKKSSKPFDVLDVVKVGGYGGCKTYKEKGSCKCSQVYGNCGMACREYVEHRRNMARNIRNQIAEELHITPRAEDSESIIKLGEDGSPLHV